MTRGDATCSEPGCGTPAHSRTLCSTHYASHRRHGTLARFPNAVEEAKARPTRQRSKAKRRLWADLECLEEGCAAETIARNLCGKHYQARHLAGTLPPKIRRVSLGRPCDVADCPRAAHSLGWCQRHYQWNRRYGLTSEQMAEVPTACSVCGSTHRLHNDHCHTTGAYRGVLCQACNIALGTVNDDADRLRRLADYVDRADST